MLCVGWLYQNVQIFCLTNVYLGGCWLQCCFGNSYVKLCMGVDVRFCLIITVEFVLPKLYMLCVGWLYQNVQIFF